MLIACIFMFVELFMECVVYVCTSCFTSLLQFDCFFYTDIVGYLANPFQKIWILKYINSYIYRKYTVIIIIEEEFSSNEFSGCFVYRFTFMRRGCILPLISFVQSQTCFSCRNNVLNIGFFSVSLNVADRNDHTKTHDQ